ncbi:MAG: hypothetical protein HWD92_07780 [Flavobacteriia bacterium]|nr:hypothetical protein [Flavobacteriia bacterium]
MSFKFEIKDSILVFRFGGDEFGAGDVQQLRNLLQKQKPQPCFINLRTPEVIEAPEELEEVMDEWFEEGHPMVFILREAHQFLFSEECVMVESHQEALDWLEENPE